jgi:hypothetical protein
MIFLVVKYRLKNYQIHEEIQKVPEKQKYLLIRKITLVFIYTYRYNVDIYVSKVSFNQTKILFNANKWPLYGHQNLREVSSSSRNATRTGCFSRS